MPSIRCKGCSRWLTPQESGEPCPRCGSLDREKFEQESDVAHEKAAVAKELAKKHYQAEAGLERIFRFTGSADVELIPAEPIKLLEVNTATVASGVLPVSFGPAPDSGIPYPSIIVEVSPEEFARIQAKELRLPEGWLVNEELPKPPEDAGGE